MELERLAREGGKELRGRGERELIVDKTTYCSNIPTNIATMQQGLPFEKKDPGDHGPLILHLMFVGTFEQFVVLSELDN